MGQPNIVRLTRSIPYGTFEDMLLNINQDTCLPGSLSSRDALVHFHGDVNAQCKALKYGVAALYWALVRREDLKDGAVIGTLPMPSSQ